MGSQYNYNTRLSALNIDKESFEKKSADFFNNEKANNDESIFSNRENFIEHYEEKLLNNKNTIDADELAQKAVDNGYLKEDEKETFVRLTDTDSGDRSLSKKELGTLLGVIYDSAQEYNTENVKQEKKSIDEIYEKVTIQPWGTGVDDCLSRIIQNHVDGIELYSENYNQYLAELCRLNNIENPDIVSGSVILPKMKLDENNEIIKDENGNIQFYTQEELENL